MEIHLDARLRNHHPPAADRGLRGLERDAVLAGHAGDRPGVFQRQFDLLGLLPLLLDQQPIALAGLAEDAGGLAGEGRGGDRGVAQPQGDFVPALGQHLDLQLRPDVDNVLFDGRHVLDFANQRADGRLHFAAGAGLFLRGPPKLLELLVGQEDAAALLLEDLPQLFVRDIDVLFENLMFGRFVGVGALLGGGGGSDPQGGKAAKGCRSKKEANSGEH